MVALRRFFRLVPMVVKVTLGLLPLYPAAALLQGALAADMLGAPLSRAQLAVLAVPLALPALAAPLVVTWVTRRRLRRITAALQRIGQGDLGARLPAPPSQDFAELADTFTRMAVALEGAMAQLRQVDRQRRRLMADLAHELATPTGAILGLADTLSDQALCPPGPAGDALRARLLQALLGESQRLSALTRDLGELAHLEDPQVTLRPVAGDLAELVAQAVERARADGAVVEVRAAPAPARLDPARIEQVLTNLISNARRHSPPGAAIQIEVGLAGDHAVLSVRDAGPGVPAELLPRLGERLWRQDPSRDRRTGGHGLGLSIVKQIVSLHRGELRFENAPGGGLRVEVRLPPG